MQILNAEQWLERVERLQGQRKYKVMYSSWIGGFVTSPALMNVPIDEHLVHRGDGVFEAIRTTPTKIFLLKPHLERLYRSADAIGIKIPATIEQLAGICEEARKIAHLEHGMLRVFIGRGPGDFSPNPYTTIGAQIYIVGMDFSAMPEEKFSQGVSALISKTPIKPSPYSQIKSCNYLQNVMMKKESVDLGFDFSVGLNEKGLIAEGPTENIMMLTRLGELVAPSFDYTLRGTTLLRVFELGQALGLKTEIRDISVAELSSAKEVMMVGTTLEVLPVIRIGKDLINDGRPGPVAKQLRALLLKDMGS